MTQLHLFNPFASLTDHHPLQDWLMDNWPIVQPWGNLEEHTIRQIVRVYPSCNRFALLLERNGYRWHIKLVNGQCYSSSPGWLDQVGNALARRAAA